VQLWWEGIFFRQEAGERKKQKGNCNKKGGRKTLNGYCVLLEKLRFKKPGKEKRKFLKKII